MKSSILALFVLSLVSWLLYGCNGKGSSLKPLEELKIRLAISSALPDPAKIETTGDWYILDHISSGLTAFDSEKNRFVPRLAESWSIKPDGTHLFKLRAGITFHDGTPITARDVVWTLKRQAILKTSTHFPLWEYLDGCENLKLLSDECRGLSVTADNEIAIRLKVRTDSFFLQVASPETGIWAASDMDVKTGALTPTKFSGAYYFDSETKSGFILRRNGKSLVVQEFPNAPKSLVVKRIPLIKTDQALIDHDVDLVVRSLRPMGEPDWKKLGVTVRETPPSTLIYFSGTGTDSSRRPAIGKDFIEDAWKRNSEQEMSSSETYLPFANNYNLTRTEFLSELPSHTAKTIRVLCPNNFFSPKFLEFLQNSAHNVGAEFIYTFVESKDWSAAFDDPKASEKYDYILSSYAASERYPAVQLRYITGTLEKPTIDLKEAESPDLDPTRVSILKDYQKWLLKSRLAIPVYLVGTLFLHSDRIDLGKQPPSDAEIELWRVQERTK